MYASITFKLDIPMNHCKFFVKIYLCIFMIYISRRIIIEKTMHVWIRYGSLEVYRIIQGKKKETSQWEWKKQKCATFSRTIELSYPNNNLDNKSMAVVPVSQSVSRTLLFGMYANIENTKTLCPTNPNRQVNHHLGSFIELFWPWSLY